MAEATPRGGGTTPHRTGETAESFGLEWTRHGQLARLYASEADLWREFETFQIPPDLLQRKRLGEPAVSPRGRSQQGR
jgi:hypothetical protein